MTEKRGLHMGSFEVHKYYLAVPKEVISPFLDEIVDGIVGTQKGMEINSLRETVNKLVTIDGYRKNKVHKAPKQILRNELNSISDNPIFVHNALNFLASSRKDVLDFVKPYVSKRVKEIRLQQQKDLSKPDASSSDQDLIRDTAKKSIEEVLKSGNIEATLDDIRLSVWISLLRLLVDGDEEIFSEGLELWQDIVKIIQDIPCDDPRWDNFDEFILRVQEIKQAKAEERNNLSQRQRLEILLNENKDKLLKRSGFFEVSGVPEWRIDRLSNSEYDKTFVLLSDLLGYLDEYDTLEQEMPLTRSQKVQQTRALDELAEKITRLYQELNQILGLHIQNEGIDDTNEYISENNCTTLLPDVSILSETVESVDDIAIEQSSVEVETDVGKATLDEENVDTEESENEWRLKEPAAPTPFSTFTESTEDSVVIQRKRVFEFIDNSQFDKAYWYLWALERLGKGIHIPSALMAALQGTQWLLGMYPDLPSVYIENLRQFVRPDQIEVIEQDYSQTVLGLSVGLILNLMPNNQGWEGWLEFHHQVRSEAFIQLLEEIKQATRHGIVLEPLIIKSILSTGSIEEEILAQARKVQYWLERATNRRAAFFRAGQVWQALLHTKNGDLYKFISKVANNNIEQVDQVLTELRDWRDRGWLEDLIQRTDRSITERKHRRPIDGEPREQLFGWIRDACDLAENWAKLVKHSQSVAQNKKNWLFERTRQFCENLSRLIEDTLNDLDAQNVGDKTDLMVSRKVLSQFLTALLDMLKKGTVADLPKLPLVDREIEADKYAIERNFAIALYYYPEVDFDPHGLPNSNKENYEVIVKVLENHPLRQADIALEQWINKHEYRYCIHLLQNSKAPEIWQTRLQEASDNDLQKLPELIDHLDAELQQALIDGLITDKEFTDFGSQLETLRKRLRTKENNSQVFVLIGDFFQRLNIISQYLQSKREKHLTSLKNRWNAIQPKLGQTWGADQINRITYDIETAFEKREIRVLDEYLSLLEKGTQLEKIPTLELNFSKDREVFREFNEELPNILNILSDPHSQGKLYQIFRSNAEISVRGYTLPQRFPTPRRKEAQDALQAWLFLKKSDPHENEEKLKDTLLTLLQFLGFTFSTPNPISIKATPSSPANFMHWRITGDIADSLVAQFGSERKRLFDVVGVWQRPGFDVISSELERIIQNYSNQPVILLFFGWIPINLRKDLFYFTRKNNIPVLVIDEALMFFLARRQDSRARAMFLCTLPYASINPYFPAAAGSAPPEIFKGREDALKKLLDFYGPCIVYGGRQLGKSTLLHMARRRFHNPEKNDFVLYADIRNIGAPASGKPHIEEFVQRLKSGLAEISFPKSIRSNELPGIVGEINNALVSNNMRLLLLLDEADNFLDADAKSNFEVIQNLKVLMDSSERRFKVVVAGLHNVQRFERMSNQPLAHLGTPIEIGPLEPNAAFQLLVEPLTQIGYRFEDANKKEDYTIPLHVLSYTNYHPGLIQYFAHALVEHLRVKYQISTLPPVSITRNDVEKVYRKREVREAIRDRFKWTLNLDPRYEAIVLSLVIEQLDEENGFDRLYSVREIYESVKLWKPTALENEGILTGLLDELCGLGILTRSEEGSKYRLRSPNLVNLLGTRDEILDDLASLNVVLPETKIQVIHAYLEGSGFSPLTLANEQALYTKRTSGVVLIFGSSATGIYDIPSAIKRTLPTNGKILYLKVASQNGNALRQQLEKYRDSNEESSYLIVMREMAAEPAQLLEQVETAISFCRRYRSPILRVIFTFDPMATWQWFQLPTDQRLAIEEQVDIILPLALWTKQAIQFSAESRWGDVFGSDSPFKKIYSLTNGWHSLLSDLFENHFDPNDAERSIDQYCQILEGEPIRKNKFIESLGLERFPQKVVSLLIKERIEPMSDDDLVNLLQIEFTDVSAPMLKSTLGYLQRLQVLNQANQVNPIICNFWPYT
jgi:hypothetical protein